MMKNETDTSLVYIGLTCIILVLNMLSDVVFSPRFQIYSEQVMIPNIWTEEKEYGT